MNTLPITVEDATSARGLLAKYIESLTELQTLRTMLAECETRHSADCDALAALGIFLAPAEPAPAPAPAPPVSPAPSAPIARTAAGMTKAAPVITAPHRTLAAVAAAKAVSGGVRCPGLGGAKCGGDVGKTSKTGLCRSCAQSQRHVGKAPKAAAEIALPKPKSDEVGDIPPDAPIPPLPPTSPEELMESRRRDTFVAARSMAINNPQCIAAGVCTIYWQIGTAYNQSKLPLMWRFAFAPEAKDTSIEEVIEVIRLVNGMWVTGPNDTPVGRPDKTKTGGSLL